MSRELRLGGCRLTSAASDHHIVAIGDTVDGQESEIVRRELILDSGIAETDNQLHSYFLPSSFLPPSPLPPSALPPSAPSSVSCLPFFMTSGSDGAAATSVAASAGAASTTSFTEVMWATGWVSSVTNLIFGSRGRSESRKTCPNSRAVSWSSS